jgi:hypothetical protein
LGLAGQWHYGASPAVRPGNVPSTQAPEGAREAGAPTQAEADVRA